MHSFLIMRPSIGIPNVRKKRKNLKGKLDHHPYLFDKVNLMWRLFRAELWSYDPVVDPPSLEHFNQFGKWVFVIRNTSDRGAKRNSDSAWFQAHKETLSIDPGLKVFQTIYNVGTGDVFMIGHGLGDQLRTLSHRIADYQSKMDTLINENDEVIALKSAWDGTRLYRFQEVWLHLLTNL